MEPMQENQLSKSDNSKTLSKMASLQDDNSISSNFDSAADCSYKSGEISSTNITSCEHLSSHSLSGQLSKIDQHLRFDSGLEADCSSSLSESIDFLSEEISKPDESFIPVISNKLQWQDIFSQDKDGDTFLHLAIVEARSDIIFPIIGLAPHPDFLDITNDLYQTPLHLATLTGKPHIVRRLMVSGATLDIQDHGGNIPLHIACRSGDLDCVQALLTPITESEIKEANCLYHIFIRESNLCYLINMKNFEGLSCVHLAAFGGWKKVLECLFSHNADINEQDGKSGRTALHYAVENENLELVNLLLTKGNANPLVQNYAGQTSCNVAYSLYKRNPSKVRQTIFDLLKKHAEKWDSASEYDYNSSSDETDMLLYHASTLLILLRFVFAFPRDKTTETPDMPLMINPKLRTPTHISEFTDPDTGLNPFLDLEEGLTSIGRNIMEDERRDDQPYFDVDLVEGDVPDRRWSLQEPKEHTGRIPDRQPEFDYRDESDFQAVTTPQILSSPLTTVDIFITKDTEDLRTDFDEINEKIEHEVEKEEKESLIISQSTVIYATVTISVMVLIVVLIGACWWRRKLKASRTSTTVESGEVKS